MFLFAELVMNNLEGQPTLNHLRQEIVHDKIPNKIEEACVHWHFKKRPLHVHISLTKFRYERIVQRLKHTLLQPQWEYSRKLLGWLVCSKRTLKWREIQAAIAMEPETMTFDFEGRELQDHVTKLCGSLVKVFDGDRVELIHITARK